MRKLTDEKGSFLIEPLSITKVSSRNDINSAVNMNPKAIFINGMGNIYKSSNDAITAVEGEHDVYMIPRFVRRKPPKFGERLRKVFWP